MIWLQMCQCGLVGSSEWKIGVMESIGTKEAQKSFYSLLPFGHLVWNLYDTYVRTFFDFSLVGSWGGFEVGTGLHFGWWNRICESSTSSRTRGNTARMKKHLHSYIFYVSSSSIFSLSFPFGHIFVFLPYLSCSIYLPFLSSLFLLSTSNFIFFLFPTFLFFPCFLLSFSLSSLWFCLSFFLSSYQSSVLSLTFLTDPLCVPTP